MCGNEMVDQRLLLESGGDQEIGESRANWRQWMVDDDREMGCEDSSYSMEIAAVVNWRCAPGTCSKCT